MSPEPSPEGPAALNGPVQRGLLVREGRPQTEFEYRLPDRTDLVAVEIEVAEGEATGLFALAAARSQGTYWGEWGIMVADVTEATPHKSSLEPAWPPPIAADAAGFLPGLREALGLAVGDIADTELGGLPALTADVAPAVEGDFARNHLDVRTAVGGATGSVFFHYPSRVIVADAGTSVVLVQIWARTEAELRGWLPLGLQVVDSMRFPGDP